jgi:hypothetical protein
LELTHASLPVTVFSFGRVPITRVDEEASYQTY